MVHSSFGERLEKRTPFIWLCQSPSNPLSHDERFLNCWIRDCSFSLDCIKDLPRYVGVGHYKTTFDDKSEYDHFFFHPSNYTFFGLEWEGRYFVYTTLPFGWKTSAYVYHSIMRFGSDLLYPFLGCTVFTVY